MKRYQLVALTSLSWLALGTVAVPAQAQLPIQSPVGPPPRPAVSPYINLVRPGDPSLNYFGLVQPQVEFRGGIRQLNQQLQSSQQAIGNLQADVGLPPTGHPTQFLNLGGYFLSRGGHGTANGPAAATNSRRNNGSSVPGHR